MQEAKKRKYLEMLAAILAGNAVYFSLQSLLPSYARHEPFALDAGLIVDFTLCLLIWILIRRRV